MGITINASANADAIVRDITLTSVSANARGAPYKDDADRYLATSLALAVSLAARRVASRVTVDTLRAQQAIQDQAANDLIAKHKDGLYNIIGRSANDPDFAQLFPNGIASYTSATPTNKPYSLDLLAGLLENTNHPRLTKEITTPIVAELRAAAVALKGVNDLFGPARSEQGLADRSWFAAARQGQRQLARLKKYWRSMGMSEAEIHSMIPAHADQTSFPATAIGLGTVDGTATAEGAPPVLTVVPPLPAEASVPAEAAAPVDAMEVIAAK